MESHIPFNASEDSAQSLDGNQKLTKASLLRPMPELPTWQTVESGRAGTLAYRARIFDRRSCKEVSPWHGIPLHCRGITVSFVCKTPKQTGYIFESAKDEENNPLKLSKQPGKPAFYTYNCQWNIGMLPQTYADPQQPSVEMKGLVNDGLALESVDIGSRTGRTGEVYAVKALGVYALIEGGKYLSWKVVCIAADDPEAGKLNDVGDLREHMPKVLPDLRQWLRSCKPLEPGQADPEIGLDGSVGECQLAKTVIARAHRAWQQAYGSLATPSGPPRGPMSGPVVRSPALASFKGACSLQGARVRPAFGSGPLGVVCETGLPWRTRSPEANWALPEAPPPGCTAEVAQPLARIPGPVLPPALGVSKVGAKQAGWKGMLKVFKALGRAAVSALEASQQQAGERSRALRSRGQQMGNAHGPPRRTTSDSSTAGSANQGGVERSSSYPEELLGLGADDLRRAASGASPVSSSTQTGGCREAGEGVPPLVQAPAPRKRRHRGSLDNNVGSKAAGKGSPGSGNLHPRDPTAGKPAVEDREGQARAGEVDAHAGAGLAADRPAQGHSPGCIALQPEVKKQLSRQPGEPVGGEELLAAVDKAPVERSTAGTREELAAGELRHGEVGSAGAGDSCAGEKEPIPVARVVDSRAGGWGQAVGQQGEERPVREGSMGAPGRVTAGDERAGARQPRGPTASPSLAKVKGDGLGRRNSVNMPHASMYASAALRRLGIQGRASMDKGERPSSQVWPKSQSFTPRVLIKQSSGQLGSGQLPAWQIPGGEDGGAERSTQRRASLEKYIARVSALKGRPARPVHDVRKPKHTIQQAECVEGGAHVVVQVAKVVLAPRWVSKARPEGPPLRDAPRAGAERRGDAALDEGRGVPQRERGPQGAAEQDERRPQQGGASAPQAGPEKKGNSSGRLQEVERELEGPRQGKRYEVYSEADIESIPMAVVLEVQTAWDRVAPRTAEASTAGNTAGEPAPMRLTLGSQATFQSTPVFVAGKF